MPERTCTACRCARDKTELLRFVREPGGSLLVDYRQKLPGRGAYTCLSRDCIVAAVDKGGFPRSFKQQVTVQGADELVDAVRAAVETRILNLIGMARKAGVIVSGSNTVLAELGKDSAALLIVAVDAAAGTADKIMHRAQVAQVPTVRLFEKQQLGAAIGRDERSHLVVTDKQFANNLILEIDRLSNIAGEK